eukprot:scaffold522_cov168-Amphora_coffeaeformis.AAC.7
MPFIYPTVQTIRETAYSRTIGPIHSRLLTQRRCFGNRFLVCKTSFTAHCRKLKCHGLDSTWIRAPP